jgi:hypothetical protein
MAMAVSFLFAPAKPLWPHFLVAEINIGERRGRLKRYRGHLFATGSRTAA